MTKWLSSLTAPSLMMLSVLTVTVGPSFIGVFSLPIAPALAGLATYKSWRKGQLVSTGIGMVLTVATVLLAIYFIILVNPTGSASVMVDGG